MKKLIKTAAVMSVISLLPISAQATSIFNGDFQNGDFSGWYLDSDGLGDPSPSSDFSIVDNAAHIQADYESNQVFFTNTLYQNLDLFTDSTEKFALSFDWKFAGDATISDEIFKVGLGFASSSGTIDYFNEMGNLGFLFEQTGYGSGTFSTLLDSSFANQGGWSLEFQLMRGFDGLGSSLQIDNVLLQTVAAVPEPSEMMLLSLGVAALCMVRRKTAVI